MRKSALYSRSGRSRSGAAAPPAAAPCPVEAPAETGADTARPATPQRSSDGQAVPAGARLAAGGRRAGWRGAVSHPAFLGAVGGAIVTSLAAVVWGGGGTSRVITQEMIDRAVRESLEKEPLPSAAAKAYEAIQASVVRVVGLMDEKDDGQEDAEKRALQRSLGTGVVIIDNGTILTNLHVVAGSRKVRVRFHNGHDSEAVLVGTQPENDLAVLRAVDPPAELEAATMTSTADLRPGDHVIAVGFPFGIGASVSYGVVSGLQREFRSPEGEKTLSNLIQFDAAANPGNSGGPLVTMDGQVVGIVTAILNPSEQRTFIGIGFAVPIENAAAAAGLPPF